LLLLLLLLLESPLSPYIFARYRFFMQFILGLLLFVAIAWSSAYVLTRSKLRLAAQAISKPISVMTTIDRLTANSRLRSLEGRSIDLIQVRIGDSSHQTSGKSAEATTRFLIQGGLHGDEKLPQKFVLWLASRVARGESALNHLPLDRYDIDFIPTANPDGDAANTRSNKAGINLNRNFGVLWGYSRENPGQESFSEPETKALEALFQKRTYAAAVDIHGYIKWLVAPSAPNYIGSDLDLGSARVSRYKKWIQTLSRITDFLGGGYKLQTAGSLGDGGAFEDWAFWKAGAFSFCLELASAERFSEVGYSSSTPAFKAFAPFANFSKLTALRSSGDGSGGKNSIDHFQTYEHAIFMAFSEAISGSGNTAKPRRPVIAE